MTKTFPINLNSLCRHCGIRDPSWSELYHFASFLNRQLQDFETSAFCAEYLLQDLPGFRDFVLKFTIEMSRVCAKTFIMS